jgi:hypothetical protein
MVYTHPAPRAAAAVSFVHSDSSGARSTAQQLLQVIHQAVSKSISCLLGAAARERKTQLQAGCLIDNV